MTNDRDVRPRFYRFKLEGSTRWCWNLGSGSVGTLSTLLKRLPLFETAVSPPRVLMRAILEITRSNSNISFGAVGFVLFRVI